MSETAYGVIRNAGTTPASITMLMGIRCVPKLRSYLADTWINGVCKELTRA